jgi:glycosyltransferase involved in cell wall biosynthesis
MFRMASRIWTTTSTYARLVEQIESSRKVLCLPNFAPSVSTERVAKTQDVADPFALLILCRIKPLKGLHVALDALAQLDDRYRLTIAGDGDVGYKDSLQNQAQSLGLSDRVTFLGRIPHGEIGDLYARSGMFLLPSLTELFGITLIEAMTYGVPIVASRVGGIPDVVEQGRSARLVPAGDPNALAEAIGYLALNSDYRRTLIQAGLLRAKDFDKDRVVCRLVDEYKDMTGWQSGPATMGI